MKCKATNDQTSAEGILKPLTTRPCFSKTAAADTGWIRRFGGGVVLAFGLCLTGCGTASALKSSSGKSTAELSRFNKVVVLDFADLTEVRLVYGVDPIERMHTMATVKRDFADMIAEEIERTGAFARVTRAGASDQETLLIGGEISEYQEGQPAGVLYLPDHLLLSYPSHFDALVAVRDGLTHVQLGTVKISKATWGFGGVLADGLNFDPKDFMRQAARKIASELQRAKTPNPSKSP